MNVSADIRQQMHESSYGARRAAEAKAQRAQVREHADAVQAVRDTVGGQARALLADERYALLVEWLAAGTRLTLAPGERVSPPPPDASPDARLWYAAGQQSIYDALVQISISRPKEG